MTNLFDLVQQYHDFVIKKRPYANNINHWTFEMDCEVEWLEYGEDE